MKHLIKWLDSQDLNHFQHAPMILAKRYLQEFKPTLREKRITEIIATEVQYRLHSEHKYNLLRKLLKLSKPELAALFGRNKLNKETINGMIEVLRLHELVGKK